MAGFGDRQASLVVGLVGGSHVLNHMYFMLLPPVTGALGEDVGVSAAEVGLAIGLLGLVVTGLQLPFGHLSDTKGRTLMLAISLSFGALGALLTATAQSFEWLLLSQLVLGVGIAGHHPAHYPLLSAATNPSTRGRAFSIHGFTGAIGFAAPPAIVAAVVTLGFSWRAAIGGIAVLGVLYGAFALLTLHRRVDDEVTAPTDTSATDENWTLGRVAALPRRAAVGLRDLFTSPGIVLLTTLWFVTSMAAWGVKTQTIPLLTGSYGFGASAANTIVSAMFVLGAVLMLSGGWLVDRTSPGIVLGAGYVAFVGITAVLASGALPIVLAVGLTLVLASSIDYSRPARATLADRFSTDDSLGKSFGLVTIGISGGAAVAPPILGYVSSEISVEMTFLAMAGLGLLSLALTAIVLRVGSTDPVGSPQPGD